MTVRQIHYTSCDDGLEGIGGFQVRSATSGVPRDLRDVALRDSVYEPGYDLPSAPTDEELGRFPVALGYAPVGAGAVIYCSTYVGRDHTGRWGNYFAHALTLDRIAELGELLPIDLWGSDVWASASSAGELPALPPLSPAAAGRPGVAAVGAFLAQPGRREALSGLLAAVRSLPPGGNQRLVVVADDAAAAASWLSALSRSLPRRRALEVSFITYTSRPEAHRALLTFTTPEVSVPPYGDYRKLDVSSRASGPAEGGGDYERLVSGLWAQGSPEAFLARVEALQPPLAEAELDDFARLASLVESSPVDVAWDDALLLDTLEFAGARAPGLLSGPWDVIASVLHDLGGPVDVDRWGAVLREALARGDGVPGPLLRSYVTVAVDAVLAGRAKATTWIPALDQQALHSLADHLVPRLAAEATAGALVPWLAAAAQTGLREQVLARLVEQYRDRPVDLHETVASVPPSTAELVIRSGTHHRSAGVYVVSLIVSAQQGLVDPVTLLRTPTFTEQLTPEDWPQVAAELWPQLVGADVARHLLAQVDVTTLRRAGFAETFVDRLIEDAAAGFGEDDLALAGALARSPLGEDMSENARRTINAVVLFGYFRKAPYDARAGKAARHAMALSGVDQRVLTHLNLNLVDWMLRTEGAPPHGDLLVDLADGDRLLVQCYVARVRERMPDLSPETVARLILDWFALTTMTRPGPQLLGRVLLDQTLPDGLHRASRRSLDKIGESLHDQPDGRRNDRPRPPKGWDNWWADWRTAHEPQGRFAKVRLPKPGRRGR